MQKTNSPLETEMRKSFQRIWIIAVCIAAVSIIPLSLMEETASSRWIICAALVLGMFIGIAFEAKDHLRRGTRNVSDLALQKQKVEGLSRFTQLVMRAEGISVEGLAQETGIRIYRIEESWRMEKRRRPDITAQAAQSRSASFAEMALTPRLAHSKS